MKWDQGYTHVANWIEKKMKGKEDQIDNYTHPSLMVIKEKEPGKQYLGRGLFGFDHTTNTLYSLTLKPHSPLKTVIRNNTQH